MYIRLVAAKSQHSMELLGDLYLYFAWRCGDDEALGQAELKFQILPSHQISGQRFTNLSDINCSLSKSICIARTNVSNLSSKCPGPYSCISVAFSSRLRHKEEE